MPSFLQVALLLAVVILAAKGAGALSKRLGQPAVFGELLVGILLGPSLLDILHWPVFTDPHYLEQLVRDLAELGVIFLMFLAGLETDLTEMRKVGTAAFFGAVGGVALPFLAGTGVALAFGFPTYESVFIGTILTATSVSITAQTLLELGRLRSREGTTILGSAVIDDVMGIVILSVVVALHQAGLGEGPGTAPGAGAAGIATLLPIVLRMAAFFLAALAVGRWLLPPVLRAAARWPGTEPLFAVALVAGLLMAVAAEELGGVAAITGSYMAGVMLTLHPDLKHHVEERLAVLAYGFFVPIFFVNIGLESDVVAAVAESGAGFLILILAAAVLGKVIGSSLGVRPFGFRWIEALRVGIGMVSRGEVALIVAGIGLQEGVISQPVFSVMVVMTLFTTLVTPVLLRWSFGRAPDSPSGAAAYQPVPGARSGEAD
ncbi:MULTISPECIES: cation:proton antiporter [Thermaerobacter]|uniref:Cation:proton antiporter n=1 Tax=Thermaerobacter composti TaxID=554949 RepID=A0ABZ0QPE6_9FIRM|nr:MULTISPECIES: cation:proton antiporter [Thermaerobacter]PZN02318.1 MAG: cation:proton antiporter [Bacillota bacterium]QBS37329.1 cation:proton antiporter [Thermaerobacter sp. FW80]WPD19364.1 cation:proton antiporter [Thermaerobacter composti]